MGMNRATTMTNRFNRSMVTARTNTNLLTSAMRGLAIGAAAGAAYGIARVTTQIVKLAAELETTTIAFEVMLKSASKAQSLVEYGMEFARITPFTQRQTFGNYRQLLAYGAPEQNVRGYGRMLSTIAAGVGMERLPFLTLALGQVIAKGRLQGQELRQFTEHGVPVVGGLSKQLGVSTQDVYEMMRRGQISSQMVVDAMKAMVTEGGLFHGMLEKLRESFTGTMNVMKSTWQIAAMEAIGPLTEAMKGWMEWAIKQAVVLERLTPSFEVLTNSLGDLFNSLGGLMPSQDRIVKEINYFTAFFTSISEFSSLFSWTLKDTGRVIKESFVNFLDVFRTFGESMAMAGRGNFMGAWNNLSNITWGPTTPFNTKEFNRRIRQAEGRVSSILFDNYKGRPKQGLPTLEEEFAKMVELWTSAFGGEGEEGAAGKKRVANRLIGTGARDIVIHIGNLIENMQISSPSMGESAEQLTERVKMAMLTAINDASILADR